MTRSKPELRRVPRIEYDLVSFRFRDRFKSQCHASSKTPALKIDLEVDGSVVRPPVIVVGQRVGVTRGIDGQTGGLWSSHHGVGRAMHTFQYSSVTSQRPSMTRQGTNTALMMVALEG